MAAKNDIEEELIDDPAATTQPSGNAVRDTAGEELIDDVGAAPPKGSAADLPGFDPKRPLSSVTKPKTFKENGILKTLAEEFTKEPDPSAKGLFKTLGYLGGLSSDAGIEGLKRILGKGGLGAEEWKKALKGEATPATQQLREAGYGPAVSYGVGLPYGALSDPLSGMFGITKEAPAAAPSAMEAAARALGQAPAGAPAAAPGATRPISATMQALARKIYGAPFKKVDAELASKYRNSAGNSHAFTDQLWNQGEPIAGGFSKTNPEIGEQITQARKDTGADIGNRIKEAGGDSEIDLAPELVENIKKEMPKDGVKLTPQQEQAIGFLPPDQQAAAVKQTLAENAKKVKPPTDTQAKEWLKGLIGSGHPESEQQGIRILSDSAPELSGVIEDSAKHLANSGSRGNILQFYHGLVDDLARGPRSLESIQDLKVAMQNAAARNQQMGANQYARNALPNVAKTADMHAADQVGKVIDGIIEDSLGSSAASAADKAKYSALRRGEVPASRAVQAAQNKPLLGTLGKFASALALYSHDPKILAAAMTAKGADLLHSSPRVATGTGMAINSAAKSNLWDNMLRRGLLNSALQKQGGNQ